MAGKNLLVFAIRDGAMGAFAAPMTFVAMGQAQRAFRDEVNSKESRIHQHPEDYEMWLLGEFVEETGQLRPSNPECVCRAKDVIVKEQ